MNKITKYFFTFSAGLFFLASAHSVFAAVLYILPEQKNFSLGENFSVDVRIDSEGEGINAAQAIINWPVGVLEFIEADKTGSAFNFWVEEPKLSGDSNSLSFIGGTAKGVSGEALQILKIKFKARGAGIAEISISDVAITASDGRGTNVLSKIKGASYGVGGEVVPQEPMSQPVKVERKAVPAENLPQKPELKVPLYQDQAGWHNNLGELVVLWDIPEDVTEMAAVIDHSPNTAPQKAEKELATGKKFGVLEEGIWYVHVRFRNNIGWGPAAYHRIALDTKPPLAFEIKLPEGESTDNPAPSLQFKTSDELSGLKEYQIRIDGNEAVRIAAAEFKGGFTLPLQAPGKHRVVVKALDQAENSVEDDVILDILPISSPAFTFVTKEIFSDESNGLAVKGIALPDINVLLQVEEVLKSEKGGIAAKGIARVDNRGNWDFTFNEPLRNGRYAVVAQSQDARGALSLAVKSEEIRVKSKPIIQIGPLQLGKGGAALALLLILVGGFSGGAWFYKKRREKLTLRVLFAESEVSKIFKLIMEDAEAISKARQTSATSDDEYTLARLKENIKKMELYIQKGLEKIKK